MMSTQKPAASPTNHQSKTTRSLVVQPTHIDRSNPRQIKMPLSKAATKRARQRDKQRTNHGSIRSALPAPTVPNRLLNRVREIRPNRYSISRALRSHQASDPRTFPNKLHRPSWNNTERFPLPRRRVRFLSLAIHELGRSASSHCPTLGTRHSREG